MKDTNIWITGSARGLGLALAQNAEQLGAHVYFGSRNTAEYYIEKGYISQQFIDLPSVHYIQCDIADEHSVKKAFAQIASFGEKIDILINNAGTLKYSPVAKMTAEHFNTTMTTNCLGAIYAAQAVLDEMIKHQKGVIINITSISVEKAFPEIGAYAASKAALAVLFRSLREEVRQHNIKVVNIAPGAINTEIWAENMCEKHGDKMLSTASLAKAIISTARLSLLDDMNIEEITIRPQEGDL